MDKQTESHTESRACCSKSGHCGSKRRCCAGKAIGLLLIIGLVAGAAYCFGTRQAPAKVGSAAAATQLASKADNIPTLRP